MMWATPVVKALSSLARYTASAPISSAVPSRPIGWRLTNISRPPGPAAAARFSIDGVSMVPGQIAFQRVPPVIKAGAGGGARGRHAGRPRARRRRLRGLGRAVDMAGRRGLEPAGGGGDVDDR